MTASPNKEQLVRGYSGRIFLLILLGTAAAFVGRNIFGPLLPAIIEDLGITSSDAGVALSVMWIAIAITQYPGGRLADQLSYKTVLVGAMGFLAIGFGVLMATTSYLGFVFGLIVMGLGAGFFTPSSYAQLATLFEERRGQAFGGYTASIDLGSAASGALAIAVLATATWRVSFLPVAIALIIVMVAMHVVHRGSYEFNVREVRLDFKATARTLLMNPAVRWAIVAYFMLNFVFQGVVGFLPAFLQFGKGLSSTLANNAFVGFFLFGAGVRLVSGHLGDQLRYLTVAAGAALIGAGGLLVLYFAETLPVIALGAAMLAAGLTGYPPVMNAYLMDRFSNSSMGGDYGAARTILILLGSMGPAYIGFLADTIDYNVSFLALVPFFLVNAAIILWLRRWV